MKTTGGIQAVTGIGAGQTFSGEKDENNQITQLYPVADLPAVIVSPGPA
jgi:hypothetical protein